MPAADHPRRMVRMSPEGDAVVSAAAASAGVSVGGLIRECAERYAAEVAREIRAGRVKVRRASTSEGARRAGAVPEGRASVPVAGADRAAAFRLMTSRRGAR